VCLFDSGNLKGSIPYMTGDSSCSNCPDDKKSCVNNLCSNDEVIVYHAMLAKSVDHVAKLSHYCTGQIQRVP